MENIIKIIGVGNAGCNMANYMYKQNEFPVSYALCSTNSDHLSILSIKEKIDIEGRKILTDSDIKKIESLFDTRVRIIFFAVGMGGRTGTMLAPIIADIAKNNGLRAIGIATIPFLFEGVARKNFALNGIEEMKKNVKAMLVIDNQLLFELYKDMSIMEAFIKIDEILVLMVKDLHAGLIEVDTDDEMLDELIEKAINTVNSPLIKERFIN